MILHDEMKRKLNPDSHIVGRSNRARIQSNGSMARRGPEIDTHFSQAAGNDAQKIKRIKKKGPINEWSPQ